jgi:tRNA(Arg) A34 adenosine deaminase TadA
MQLKTYLVKLRRKGGKSHEQTEVPAAGAKHAERVAIRQVIDTKHQASKPADWIVVSVEAKP